MDDEKKITWEAPEFDYVEKSVGWYFIFGVVFFAMIVFGWFNRNFFFMIFLLIAGILVVALSNRKPEKVKFILGEEACTIGASKTPYRYSEMKGFAIVEREHRNNLLVFRRNVAVNQYLKLPLEKGITSEVRSFLKEKLAEGSYEEGLLDVLIDRVGLGS
jgi:hypothetical protein